MSNCALCGGGLLESAQVIGRRDVCPACGRDLHCCLQCRFWDPNVHHECREPLAEYVKEKDVANFCDYFSLHGTQREGMSGPSDAKVKVKLALEKLFQK